VGFAVGLGVLGGWFTAIGDRVGEPVGCPDGRLVG
jgi:hypothetical protein